MELWIVFAGLFVFALASLVGDRSRQLDRRPSRWRSWEESGVTASSSRRTRTSNSQPRLMRIFRRVTARVARPATHSVRAPPLIVLSARQRPRAPVAWPRPRPRARAGSPSRHAVGTDLTGSLDAVLRRRWAGHVCVRCSSRHAMRSLLLLLHRVARAPLSVELRARLRHASFRCLSSLRAADSRVDRSCPSRQMVQ
jgi:hypothetical protein